ncbi:MAG: hypothetical protein ABEJ82_05680 [Haloplanus sp.]
MGMARARGWLRSTRVLLGATALTDLAVRVPTDVLAPLVSLTGGVLGSPAVGFVTTWVMFAVALYTFGPRAYDHFGEAFPRDRPGFRACFAAGAVGFGVGVHRFRGQSWALVAFALPTALSAGALLLGYLVRVHDWDLTDPEGRAVSVLELVSPHDDVAAEVESDLAYEGWRGRVSRATHYLSVALILGTPVALGGVVVEVLTYAFPVPDVAFLGWALSARVVPRVTVGPDRDRVMDLEFDIERFLLDKMENATRSLEGLFATAFAVLGLLHAGAYLFLAVWAASRVAVPLGATVGTLPVAAWLPVWNGVGVPTVLTSAGLLGLWVWIRELHRLPYFLDAWEGRDFAPDGDPLPRVSGFVGVPVAGWLLTAVYGAFGSVFVRRLYAVGWPLVVGLAVVAVRHTLARERRPPASQYRWMVGGLVVQATTLPLGANIGRLADATSTREAFASVLTVPVAYATLLLVVSLVPWVDRYDDRYRLVGFLFALGTLAAAGAAVLPADYRAFALALVGVGWGFGVLLALVRYYDL